VLADSEERFDLVLDDRLVYISTAGTGVSVLDDKSVKQRVSQKQDMARIARVEAPLY
jgi:hypothetical protein